MTTFMRLVRLRSVVLMITVLVCVFSLPATAVAQPVAEGIFIPVIINLYPNSGVATVAEAEAYVKEANEALKQAGFTLVPVKSQNILAGQGGDDGDGELTRAERDAARKYGEEEINKTRNQKGIKISFVKMPDKGDPDCKGVSIHGNPTMIVRKSTKAEADKYKRTITQDTGETIAHEFGHIKTIEGDYPIDPKNPWKMDSDATGDKFKPEEIEEMKKSKLKHGKCSIQMEKYYPAVKLEQWFGTTTDARGDQSGGVSPIYDLDFLYLASVTDAEAIDVQLTVTGVLPDSEDINATYSIGFDIDADSTTGVLYAGYQGIDRIVYVNATGNISLDTFTVTGEVSDTTLGTALPLLQAPVARTEHEFIDFKAVHIPAATSFLFEVPKGMLSLSASEAPAVATAGLGASLYDTAGLVFDSKRWLKDPTLTTFGTGIPTPGENYKFTIAGLKPYDTFNLYVDERLVLSDTLDASGGYSGEFVFSSDLPNTEMYFLTAQDSTGEFAYSITCPKVPSPPVGGISVLISVPVDNTALLASYIGLTSTLAVTTVATAVYVKRVKRRKEKQ